MAKVHAYLNFNGNCDQAFQFYAQVFGTKTSPVHRFGDMPNDPDSPQLDALDQQKVMHVSLPINEHTQLMGSDCLESFGQKIILGNNNYVMLDVYTAEEAKMLYDKLSVNAQVMEMELAPQFFAELFSSFIDQFGTPWMIHFEGNRAENFQ